MRKPEPITIEEMDGKVVRARCAACDDELQIGSGVAETPEKQQVKVMNAFGKHLREKHPEDFSQAAARIVR
jgi:hypothetical protein